MLEASLNFQLLLDFPVFSESLTLQPLEESNQAPDPRLYTYDSTCQIAQEIAEKLHPGDQHERNGENATRVSPDAGRGCVCSQPLALGGTRGDQALGF